MKTYRFTNLGAILEDLQDDNKKKEKSQEKATNLTKDDLLDELNLYYIYA